MRTSVLCSALAIFSLAGAEPFLHEVGHEPPATCKSPPVPTPLLLDAEQKLQLRQAAVVNPGATPAASYPPTITTKWQETTVNGVSTWVPIAYTQTFAKVPDQWPSPGIGEIGYGTLKKMFAQPAEIVIGIVEVRQGLHVLEVVEVVETRTVVESVATRADGNGTGFGTGVFGTAVHDTAAYGTAAYDTAAHGTAAYGTAAYDTAAFGTGPTAYMTGVAPYATGLRTHNTGPTAFPPSRQPFAAHFRFFA